jgi:integrase
MMTILRASELKTLVEQLAADRWPSIARLALLAQCASYTGARLGEILAMSWRDLDFATGRWNLQRSFEMVDGKLVIRAGKTAAARRVLNLGPELIRLLSAHRTSQAERLLAQGRRASWVFDDGAGEPLRPNTISSHWGKAMRRLDFTPRIKFHALRHLYASYALNAGASLLDIQADLGHADKATTFLLYSHLLPNSGRTAAKVEAKLLGAGTPHD